LSPAAAYVEGVDFPNANTIPYYVGIQHADLPSALTINPRTGEPEWTEQTDTIGVTDEPDSVVDNGNGTLTANLDAICGGLDCSGRTAVIFQNDLASGALNLSIALETLIVSWSGSANTITTAGALGQPVISTTAADYTIILLGPIVRGTTTIKTQDGVVYVGKITGNGPAATPIAFDYTDQQNANSLATIFSTGFSTDLFPDTDNIYDIGQPGLRWRNMYIANLNLGGDLLPALHDTYHIGANATRWKDVFISGTLDLVGNVKGHFYPVSDATYDLGITGTNRWRSIYAYGDCFLGDLYPTAHGSRDLGSTGFRWRSLYLTGGIASGGSLNCVGVEAAYATIEGAITSTLGNISASSGDVSASGKLAAPKTWFGGSTDLMIGINTTNNDYIGVDNSVLRLNLCRAADYNDDFESWVDHTSDDPELVFWAANPAADEYMSIRQTGSNYGEIVSRSGPVRFARTNTTGTKRPSYWREQTTTAKQFLQNRWTGGGAYDVEDVYPLIYARGGDSGVGWGWGALIDQEEKHLTGMMHLDEEFNDYSGEGGLWVEILFEPHVYSLTTDDMRPYVSISEGLQANNDEEFTYDLATSAGTIEVGTSGHKVMSVEIDISYLSTVFSGDDWFRWEVYFDNLGDSGYVDEVIVYAVIVKYRTYHPARILPVSVVNQL